MNNLVIVESGAKGKTISKYLNVPELKAKYGVFKVVASNGHIRDLVKKKSGTESGIDVDNWIAHYDTIKEKSKVIKALKEAIRAADMVWLAADLDREGEGIAWHIKEYFKLKKYKRITFNEITQSAIINAVNNPRDIDFDLVDAQQGRRILDRIIGFRLTQILWKNFDTFSTMSAGRVQSVLLMIICNNEKKIVDFITTNYWNVLGHFKLGTLKIETKLYNSDGVLTKFDSKEQLLTLFKALQSAVFKIDKNNTIIKQKTEKPQPPFITSTLQQEAHSKLGFSSKMTMKTAQDLYEAGHITYMRTDSTNLSNEAMKLIQKYVSDTYDAKMFEDNNSKNRGKKSKNAQEAHEAVRPTKMVSIELNKDQLKLYQLIFNRTIASQMTHAVYEELNIHINSSVPLPKQGKFIGKTKALVSPGYLVVYDIKKEKSMDKMLKNIQESEQTVTAVEIIGNHVWMTPPQHFNESKVIKTLESLGIGRPSTYSTILDKLFQRQFIETTDITGEEKTYEDVTLHFEANKIKSHKELRPYFTEKNKIVPTANGGMINEFISKHFSKIINVEFTSLMEDDLDAISSGGKKLPDVMKKFYAPFVAECEKLQQVSGKTKVEGFNKEFKIKGKDYIIRNAKYGPVIQKDTKFISLTAFMEDTNKKIEDIVLKDVALLVSMPMKIDSNRTLQYGRYGFYVKFETEGQTLRVYKNMLDRVFEGDFSKLILK